MERVEAKYIRTEKFSNKNFFIEIELYEHGLAKGRCEEKRRGTRGKRKWWRSPFLYFPSYHWVTIMEWNEFYSNFENDKIARRWVRRIMRHCFDGFLTPGGDVDHTKFAIEDDRREHRSREYYKMNKEQLVLMKKLLPGFFNPGTFRTGVYENSLYVLEASSLGKYKTISPHILNHPIAYRKYLYGRTRFDKKKYFDVERLKAFIKEFDPAFYRQVCEERTMENCNIELEYKFPPGESPEMRIFVQDNEYVDYTLPNY